MAVTRRTAAQAGDGASPSTQAAVAATASQAEPEQLTNGFTNGHVAAKGGGGLFHMDSLQRARSAAVPAATLLAWSLCSSVLIFANKIVMVDYGFRYPLMLTAWSQFASAIAGLAVAWAGVMRLGPPPSLRFFALRLLPIVLCSAGTLFLGNFSYLKLSVAFIQMLKALTPAMTLALCLALGLEPLRWPVAAAVGMITLGTGVTTLLETDHPHFDWLGCMAFASSAALESLKVVLIQVLLGRLEYNTVEVLVYIGPPTGLVLLAASLLSEWHGLTAGGGFAAAAAHPAMMALVGAASAAVNFSSYFAISRTSSLTFKMAGCVKNAVIVLLGVLMGDVVSATQVWGYTLAVAGFLTHALHQQRAATSSQKRAKTS